MQIHSLKLKTARPKRKTIGRGGKKGTYCGKGCKGQKARTGAHVDPLFEGGRSTLIDHMKKKRGFTSGKNKRTAISLKAVEKKFKAGDKINVDSLIKAGLVDKLKRANGVKIIGGGKHTKKLEYDASFLFSKSIKK